ncbi:hypothetical protein SAMN05216489_04919 [Streptomyces sp. 3213]|nr:hypothetical protein SAMN05216489_04919 [Streptomyces sp. 3213] [Streptomyces sp. 3213.3]
MAAARTHKVFPGAPANILSSTSPAMHAGARRANQRRSAATQRSKRRRFPQAESASSILVAPLQNLPPGQRPGGCSSPRATRGCIRVPQHRRDPLARGAVQVPERHWRREAEHGLILVRHRQVGHRAEVARDRRGVGGHHPVGAPVVSLARPCSSRPQRGRGHAQHQQFVSMCRASAGRPRLHAIHRAEPAPETVGSDGESPLARVPPFIRSSYSGTPQMIDPSRRTKCEFPLSSEFTHPI